MANIERHGLMNDTVILFMSDNGGLSASGRGGEPHTHNRPLSSGKGSAHEGGVRVPMLVSWPGVTAAGSMCNQPIIIEDFFTTILEIAGSADAKQVGGSLDGVSFVPLLRGKPMEDARERPLFWHFPNHWETSWPTLSDTV